VAPSAHRSAMHVPSSHDQALSVLPTIAHAKILIADARPILSIAYLENRT